MLKKALQTPSFIWLSGMLVAGCSDTGPVVYTAQLYDPDAQCVSSYQPIGLVDAKELNGLCAPACLDVGGALYVSTGCPPYPSAATAVSPADNPDCAAALVAPACP
jgi:hypothetical protein